MLAALGFAATSFVHLPGDMHAVSAVAAHDAAVKTGAMSQILLWTSAWEIVTFKVPLLIPSHCKSPYSHIIHSNHSLPVSFVFHPGPAPRRASPR